jgi:hypothetical protein
MELGSYLLTASKTGYISVSHPVTVAGIVTVDFVLPEVPEIPYPPSNMVATEASAKTEVALTWEEPQNGSVKSLLGYAVYRLTEGAPETQWTSLSNNVTGLSYTDGAWATLSAGNYQWAVKANYSGDVTSEATLSNVLIKELGIENREEPEGFAIYPNPVNDGLKIIRFTGTPAQIEIYNSLGAKLLSFEMNEMETEINVSALPAGIYMIRFLDFNQMWFTQTKTFVKQ